MATFFSTLWSNAAGHFVKMVHNGIEIRRDGGYAEG